MEIIKGGIIESTNDYTSNLRSLKNDADSIRTSIMEEGKTAKEAYSKMKGKSLHKALLDWFYTKGEENDMYGDLDYGTDDFDAGFGDTEDGEEIEVSQPLNVDSMKGIARGQLGAMYNIAGKQTEASMANTAEVVSTFNTRSSEIIASIGKIESSLNSISQKMDTLIKAVDVSSSTKSNQYGDKDSVYDIDGMLSPLSLFNNLKRGLKEDSILGSGMGFLKMGMGSDGFTPEGLLSMGLSSIYEKQKFSFLGNKTIDEVGNQFNDTVKSITHNALAEFIDSKPMQAILDALGMENPMYTSGQRDYSKIRTSSFNDKPATFDGLTRHSIIHTIPEYLKNIHTALTGKSLVVDNKGQLTDNPTDKFGQVTQKAFADSGLDYGVDYSIANEARAGMPDISSTDVNEASKVLTMIYVMYLYQSGNTMLKTSQISSTDVNVINRAVKTLTTASGKSEEYWSNICLLVLHRLERNMNEATKFAANVNVRLRSMDEEAEKLAKSSTFFGDIGKLSYEMAEKEYVSKYKERQASYEGNDIEISSSSGIGNKGTSADFTMLDYTRGIFNVLNRGINVRVTNKPGDYSGYKSFKLNHVEKVASVQDQVSEIKDTIEINKGDGKTYIEKMLEGILPKSSHRFGMQYFANKNKDDNDQPSMWDTYEDTSSGKLKQQAKEAADKVKGFGKKIFGERVDDVGEDGKTRHHREGGLINNVGSFLYEKASGIGGGITDKIAEGIERRKAKSVLKDTQAKLDRMNPTNDTEKDDQQKAQTVLSMMNAAAIDGDTEADLSDINSIIQSISDPKLKNRLQSSVMPLLRRSGDKNKGGKGIIGKVLGLGLAAVKLLLTPVIKTIGAIAAGIKAIGSRIVSVMKTYTRNAVIDLRVGVSNIFRSMFGRKAKFDSSGNLIHEKEDGLIQILFEKQFKKISTGYKSFTNKLSGVLDVATKGLDSARKKLASGMDKLFEKVGKMGNSAMDWVSKKYFDNRMKKTEPKDLSNRNEFMKGFLGVFEESKKAKREALLKSKRPETYADVKANEIKQEVSEVSKTTKDSKSILSQIRDKLDAIINKNDKSKNASEKSPKRSSEKEIDSSVKSYMGVKQKLDMMDMITGDKNGSGPAVGIPGGASVSFSVANAKGTNPTNVVPNTVQQPQTLQTNVQPVVTDIGGSGDKSGSEKTGSKVGKALGAIGKGVGGLVSISGFILKILGPALASMSGMQSLMKLASNTLKIIAKPVNSIFKELTKTMRPLFKKIAPMISNILSIVGGLVSDLMPLVTTLAGATMSLLPALTPVIKAVTTIISPLIKGLNGLLETVIVPTIQIVAGAVTGLLGGILWLGGSIVTALGKVVKAISKKKGGSIVKFGESVQDSGTETMKEAGNLFKSALGPIINKITDAMGGKDSSSINDESESFEKADINDDGKVDETDIETFKKENFSIMDWLVSISNPWKAAEKAKETEEFMAAYNDATKNKNDIKLNRLEVAKDYGLTNIDTTGLVNDKKFQESMKSYADVSGHSYDDLMQKIKSGEILDNRKLLSEMLTYAKLDYEQNREQNKKVNEHYEFDEDATKKGMLPFIAKMKTRLLPTIDKISNVGDAVYGGLMYAAGMLLSAVSLGFSDTGKQLVEEGKAKISQAMSSGDFTADTPPSTPSKDLVEYAKRQTTSTYTEYTSGPLIEERYQQPLSGQTSILDNQGIFYYSSYDDIYGSGDISQKSFGSFMNMSKRGCGPVALAEAYARRTGSRVNPAQLAKGMARTGAYNPNMGTSVNGFINTGNSMGMGMYAGGVTESSLRSASPHNPITVFGSGPAYGTRKGNNHFMNVIGSDGQGNGYVSNPLTGKTTKRSLNSIARGSSLGLYGSGDDNLEEAKSQIADVKSSMDLSNIADIDSIINDDTKTALSDLKNLANKILSIFELDEGDASVILEQEETMAQIEQNKSVLSDEEKATLEEDAKKLFETENPRVAGDPGETDEEYESRWQKVKNKFLLIASNEKAKKYFTDRAENVKTFTEKISQSFNLSLLSSGSNGSSGGSGGTISSKDGVVLATPYEVTITKPNVRSTNPGETTESPLHEFFKNTTGSPAWSSDGNFFRFRRTPNSMGVGSTGKTHDGIDIQVTGSSSNNKPMYATTDGTVTYVAGGITRDRGGMADNGGGGNYVAWKDVAGNTHRYLHLYNSRPAVSVGDKVIGGQTLLGFMGDTGSSEGHHLHYDISNTSGNRVNPIEFFSVYTPPSSYSGNGTAQGDTIKDQIYTYLTSSGLSPMGAAGMMGCFRYESVYDPGNLEDVYNNRWTISDKEYVNRVNNKQESREKFATGRYDYYMSHQTPGEAVGFGLPQFTTSKFKYSLYDKTVARGKSITDIPAQMDTIMELLRSEPSRAIKGPTLIDDLNNARTPTEANQYFLWRYEAGNGYNSDAAVARDYSWMDIPARHREAEDVYAEYKNKKFENPNLNATIRSNTDAFTENSDGTFTVKQGNSTLVSRDGYSKEHLQDLMGSGDEYTLDDLLNTNRFNDTFDTSLIDTSIPESDGNNQPIIVNRYITYDEGKNDERLKMILSNTYNVRARRVEELLEEIIEKMDDNDDKPKPTDGSGTRNTTPSNMFDENGIPKALQRLYTE